MANDDSDRNEGIDDDAEENGSSRALLSALKSKEVLIPAAISAAGAVAATAGPSLLRRAKESTEQKGEQEAENLGRRALDGARSGLKSRGGIGGIAGGALSKATGGGAGEGGGKKTRRLPIQRWTDVAVPVEEAYEAWTQFDQYPQFMHRVLNVRRKGDDKVQWQEKIWFSTREWEGKITDRRKNDRIAWKTTNGMSHKGVVTFHKLDDNLTRVMVDMEFEPSGVMEKMASGMRFVKRAVQADLARFKAYVELEDAKGIEYRPVKEGGEEKNDDRGRGSRRSRDDSSREQGRNERQSRREERRESVGAR